MILLYLKILNKNKLKKLEKSVRRQLKEDRWAPAIWSPKGVVATKEANFKDDVFQTAVRDNIAIPEAPVRGSYISDIT